MQQRVHFSAHTARLPLHSVQVARNLRGCLRERAARVLHSHIDFAPFELQASKEHRHLDVQRLLGCAALQERVIEEARWRWRAAQGLHVWAPHPLTLSAPCAFSAQSGVERTWLTMRED